MSEGRARLREAIAALRALPIPAGGWVTRFAPSPTGELHLGHVLHATWVFSIAEAVNAKVVIRMEDHDQTRSTRAFEASILRDLEWLGFHPDPVSLQSLQSHPSPYRQSDHPVRYHEALAQLERVARVYPCQCTRAMMGAPDQNGERRHRDECRGASIVPDTPSALRVELPDVEVQWHDLVGGRAHENPWRRVGDTQLRDTHGQWSYQFGVVVDDLHDGVNLIVRGDDIRHSTARQILLGNLLGANATAVYCHHPLLFAPDGTKLSKRDMSATVRSMCESGMTAEQVITAAMEECE